MISLFKKHTGMTCRLFVPVIVLMLLLSLVLFSCSADSDESSVADDQEDTTALEVNDLTYLETEPLPESAEPESAEAVQDESVQDESVQDESDAAEEQNADEPATDEQEKTAEEEVQADPVAQNDASALRAALNITEDYRSGFDHGEKGAQYQKYIVLHDTEDNNSAQNIMSYWDSSGEGVAAHFIINKDGSIVQCVPLDRITHHAGFGDTGHNETYGVTDESRDDKVGTVPVGSWASDYGMNSYSIGIELVHVGGSGDYPEAQLVALDNLIAYIDAYYGGNAGQIIDHKAWRTGNSDTSAEFSAYLASYQTKRTHA